MKLNLFLILILSISSCNTSPTNDNEKVLKQEVNSSDEKLNTALPKEISFVDSTNFDNYRPENPLAKDQVNAYQLDKLNFPAENYFLRKEIDFSNSFKTKIFTGITEMEMKTFLVTYDSTGKLIDHLLIAYDEIAESAFRTITRIDENVIHIDEYNYMDGNHPKQTISYVLNSKGEFIKMDILKR